MKPSALALLALAALVAPAAAGAHGVSVEIDRREGAVAVRARYEGGRPLADARFEVVSPAQPGRAFVEGLTDRHGWLVFVPDAPGTWRVRIADASGHGRLAEIEVTPPAPASAPATAPPLAPAPPAAPAAALPAPLRTALGAAALALAFAALLLVQRRRRRVR